MIRRGLHLLKVARSIRAIRKANTQATQQVAQKVLAEQLAGMRGLPMKVGQLLAGSEGENAYTQLSLGVEPWPLSNMQCVMDDVWQDLEKFPLVSIEESLAAASLGQVHQAVLLSGETVAVKIQYPDIGNAIDAEMKLLGLLPAVGPVKRWHFDLQGYKRILKQNLEHELDYVHEMHQQQSFAAALTVPGVIIPQVFPELCRKQVLVQQWVEGARLQEVRTWPLTARLYIARCLMQTMFQSVFAIGLVHGDPHAGNMLFQYNEQQPTMTLLDYGCMVEIDENRRLALLKLILSARQLCSVSIIDAFVALGFDVTKLTYIEDKLPLLLQVLFQPFIEDRPYDVSQWDIATKVEGLLGEQRWWFRAAGPADLFLLMRIFQGLVEHLKALDVKLPWWPILQQSISSEYLEFARQWQPVEAVKHAVRYQGAAKVLRLYLLRSGSEAMEISFPAYEALHLTALLPDNMYKGMNEVKDELSIIEQRLQKEGLEPQLLLDIADSDIVCKLWLE